MELPSDDTEWQRKRQKLERGFREWRPPKSIPQKVLSNTSDASESCTLKLEPHDTLRRENYWSSQLRSSCPSQTATPEQFFVDGLNFEEGFGDSLQSPTHNYTSAPKATEDVCASTRINPVINFPPTSASQQLSVTLRQHFGPFPGGLEVADQPWQTLRGNSNAVQERQNSQLSSTIHQNWTQAMFGVPNQSVMSMPIVHNAMTGIPGSLSLPFPVETDQTATPHCGAGFRILPRLGSSVPSFDWMRSTEQQKILPQNTERLIISPGPPGGMTQRTIPQYFESQRQASCPPVKQETQAIPFKVVEGPKLKSEVISMQCPRFTSFSPHLRLQQSDSCDSLLVNSASALIVLPDTLDLARHMSHRLQIKVVRNSPKWKLLILGVLWIAAKLEGCRLRLPTAQQIAKIASSASSYHITSAIINSIEIEVMQGLEWQPLKGWDDAFYCKGKLISSSEYVTYR